MFRWLAFRRSGLRNEPGSFDPTSLGDLVATETEWRPLRSGGASWTTYRLEQIDSTRVEFRATGISLAVYGLVLLIGVLSLHGAFNAARFFDEAALQFVLGVSLLLLGAAALYSGTAPIVFDRHRNAFWKQRVAPYEAGTRQELGRATPLDRIHAVQIVSEHCRDEDSVFYSHELNLVLENGARVNVVDHWALETVREDARRLSLFLGVPVWDATR